MNKIKFERSLTALLYFKNVEPNKHLTDMMFNLIKNDFTDEEFGNICLDICKTEELYNKYPDPKLFYDRKQGESKTILVEEGCFYIDDTMPKYKAIIADLDQDTRDRICDNVWRWLMENKRGEMISEQFVIDRLKQFRPFPVDYEEPITLTEVKKLLSDHEAEKTSI